MRNTLILFFITVLQVNAIDIYSQNTRITLNLSNVTVAEVLEEIENSSEFYFLFNSNLVDVQRDVSISVKNKKISEILTSLFSGTEVNYLVYDRQIILAPHDADTKEMAAFIQQQLKVTGTVTDEKGDPFPGVNVQIEGTSIGAITDINGKYSIEKPDESAILIFSFVGYTTQRIPVGAQTTINASLTTSTVDIGEIVIVGFGTQKKESVVGAISQVKGSDLVKAGVPSIANSLTGRVAGMVTVQLTGMPGADAAKIYIRGLSSFTGDNAPLVLVDGIERSMNDIDPSEVESISVLKDASATAVFGVKGGNGVILVTTKRGEEGKMEISATYEQTWNKPTSHGIQESSYPTLYDRDLMYRNQNYYSKVVGFDVLEHYRLKDNPYIYPDVDAWDIGIKDYSMDNNASISARGGTKVAKYFISLGYLHQGDIMSTTQTLYDPSYKYDRYSFRMNFDFDLTKTTRLSISSSGFVGSMSFGGQQAEGDNLSITSSIYAEAPYVTPYLYPASFVAQYPDPNNPEISDRVAAHIYSPASRVGLNSHNYKGTTRNTRDRLGTDITLNQKLDVITKGLSFKVNFSYNTNSTWTGNSINYATDLYVFTQLAGNSYKWERYVSNSVDNYSVISPPSQSGLSRAGNDYNYVYSGQLNYIRSFGKNNLTGLGLVERRISQSSASFPHYEEKWVGRATYDYDGKYLFEASIGVSGSEQFAPANRFGYFPSVAVGWNLAREAFVKQLVPEVNNLKIRYSYGETGNDNTGSQWLYISEFTNYKAFTTGSPGLSMNNPTVKEGKVPNINAQWERAKKHDLGLDLALFKNSVTFTGEVYSETRDGILMARRAVATWFGQSISSLNIGSTKRHGFELEAGYNNSVGRLHYWIKGNFNFNENRVINQDDPAETPEYQKSAGKPIGYFSSPLNIGYYTDRDEIANYSLRQSTLMTIGADKVLDFNGDATTSNDAVPMGHTNRPDITYGFSAGLEYRDFDFSFLVQGVSNVDRSWSSYSNPMWVSSPGEYYIKVKGRDDIWSPDNTDAEYANWGAWNPASKGITNARYLRLKSLELGYTLTGRYLKVLGLSSARLAFQGSNLLTWAPGYTIGDPENEGAFDFYPIPKQYSLVIKVNF